MSTINTSYTNQVLVDQNTTNGNVSVATSTTEEETPTSLNTIPVDSVEISDEAKALAATASSSSTSTSSEESSGSQESSSSTQSGFMDREELVLLYAKQEQPYTALTPKG